MNQEQALNILKTGANVFLSGEPGAGKTHTINDFVEYLRAHDIEPAITASTGIAATHIGGMTIHSWSGIGIKSHLDRYDVDKIASSEYIVKRMLRTKVLIIDEVSMLTANMVDMIDMVCREVRQNPEPFGGIQVIFVGDFFQLPPIVKRETDPKKQKALLESDEFVKNNTFAYESNAWGRAKPVVCYLSEQHRQDDDTFLSLLSAIRADNVEEEHFEYITSRQIERTAMPENVTKLFSHNVDVDRVNSGELAKIKEKAKFFVMNTTGSEAMVASIKKGCLSPENLELKVGAVVMCTKNNPKEGYMNGTLGTVIGFEEPTGYPIIKAMNGKTITITPMDWIVEENGKIRAQVSQVPLRLAWAIAVHKSQGMSLDAVEVDLAQDTWEKDSTVEERYRRMEATVREQGYSLDDHKVKNAQAATAVLNARESYIEVLRSTVRRYRNNIQELGALAGVEVAAELPSLENDDTVLAQAGLRVNFNFDGKGSIGLNDGEASGGQQVIKSLILLVGLLKDEDSASGGFVFIDEPFAHLDVRNIQLVGHFLRSTQAQYVLTTPITHNLEVFEPAEITLVTSKKPRDSRWAPPIAVAKRRGAPGLAT